MLKYSKLFVFVVGTFTYLSLSGCARDLLPLPVSESKLISKAINNGFEAEIDLNYIDAYSNLKQAYKKCVAFKRLTDHQIVLKTNLDRESKIGTIIANTNLGGYVSKVELYGINDNKSKMNFYLPESKFFTANYNLTEGKKRFEDEIKRALGVDSKCNRN